MSQKIFLEGFIACRGRSEFVLQQTRIYLETSGWYGPPGCRKDDKGTQKKDNKRGHDEKCGAGAPIDRYGTKGDESEAGSGGDNIYSGCGKFFMDCAHEIFHFCQPWTCESRPPYLLSPLLSPQRDIFFLC